MILRPHIELHLYHGQINDHSLTQESVKKPSWTTIASKINIAVNQNTDSSGNHKGLKMRKPFNINHNTTPVGSAVTPFTHPAKASHLPLCLFVKKIDAGNTTTIALIKRSLNHIPSMHRLYFNRAQPANRSSGKIHPGLVA